MNKNKNLFSVGVLMLVFALVIPALSETGLLWKIKKIRHSSFVKNIEIIEIKPEEILGNTIENTNNYGFGVKNEDYIFYVKNHLSLLK